MQISIKIGGIINADIEKKVVQIIMQISIKICGIINADIKKTSLFISVSMRKVYFPNYDKLKNKSRYMCTYYHIL